MHLCIFCLRFFPSAAVAVAHDSLPPKCLARASLRHRSTPQRRYSLTFTPFALWSAHRSAAFAPSLSRSRTVHSSPVFTHLSPALRKCSEHVRPDASSTSVWCEWVQANGEDRRGMSRALLAVVV